MAVAPVIGGCYVRPSVSHPSGDRHAGLLVRFAVDLAESATFDRCRQSRLRPVRLLYPAMTKTVRRDAPPFLREPETVARVVVEATLRLRPSAVCPAQTFGLSSINLL